MQVSNQSIIANIPVQLLNAAGILLVVQGILILQPTSTASQKVATTYYHAGINSLGMLALLGGLAVIEYNKIKANNPHFHSLHAYFGVIAYSWLVFQALVGTIAFFLPALLGGERNAKAMYKWHRLSGYVLLVVSL